MRPLLPPSEALLSSSSVVPSPVLLRHARLVHLLASDEDDRPPFAFASTAAIREARALGPEIVTEAVVALLDAYRPGGDHALPSRAAYLIHELPLEGAIPALIACLERLPEGDPMTIVCAGSLDFLGEARVSPLLEAFARISNPDARWHIGMSLSTTGAGTAGVREALESMLASEPGDAAVLLVHHGDRRAVPALRRALDRLELPPPGPNEVTALERIINVGHAILELRGALDRTRREKLERANARYDELAAPGILSGGLDADDGPARLSTS